MSTRPPSRFNLHCQGQRIIARWWRHNQQLRIRLVLEKVLPCQDLCQMSLNYGMQRSMVTKNLPTLMTNGIERDICTPGLW